MALRGRRKACKTGRGYSGWRVQTRPLAGASCRQTHRTKRHTRASFPWPSPENKVKNKPGWRRAAKRSRPWLGKTGRILEGTLVAREEERGRVGNGYDRIGFQRCGTRLHVRIPLGTRRLAGLLHEAVDGVHGQQLLRPNGTSPRHGSHMVAWRSDPRTLPVTTATAPATAWFWGLAADSLGHLLLDALGLGQGSLCCSASCFGGGCRVQWRLGRWQDDHGALRDGRAKAG